MKSEEPSHRETGLSAILSKPWVYDLFTSLVGKESSRIKLVQNYVRPYPGCRILEIGCGTGRILSYLPNSIAEYTGFDMNPLYIESAKKRWKGRDNCRFFCHKVEDAATLQPGHYDIVLAVGIVHHLNDNEAAYLFDIAYQTLKLDGVLITYDNVYVENQNWFAKWLISRDRGRAVRTIEDYKRLAVQYFVDIEGNILHDALRIPYTIFIMRCIKRIIR
jgi:SAM-dependent methyltransferase